MGVKLRANRTKRVVFVEKKNTKFVKYVLSGSRMVKGGVEVANVMCSDGVASTNMCRFSTTTQNDSWNTSWMLWVLNTSQGLYTMREGDCCGGADVVLKSFFNKKYSFFYLAGNLKYFYHK